MVSEKELEDWFDSGISKFNSVGETGQERSVSHQRPQGVTIRWFGTESMKNPKVLENTKSNTTGKCQVLDTHCSKSI